MGGGGRGGGGGGRVRYALYRFRVDLVQRLLWSAGGKCTRLIRLLLRAP